MHEAPGSGKADMRTVAPQWAIPSWVAAAGRVWGWPCPCPCPPCLKASRLCRNAAASELVGQGAGAGPHQVLHPHVDGQHKEPEACSRGGEGRGGGGGRQRGGSSEGGGGVCSSMLKQTGRQGSPTKLLPLLPHLTPTAQRTSHAAQQHAQQEGQRVCVAAFRHLGLGAQLQRGGPRGGLAGSD